MQPCVTGKLEGLKFMPDLRDILDSTIKIAGKVIAANDLSDFSRVDNHSSLPKKNKSSVPDSNLEADNPIQELLNSLVANVFMDPVTPLPGSVVICSLAGGLEVHSGIYAGDDQIIELNGNGEIISISPYLFLEGLGDGLPFRTGISVYVACNGCKPLANVEICHRAQAKCHQQTNYNVVLDNCHDFTRYCLTGGKPTGITDSNKLFTVIAQEYGLDRLTWRVWDYENNA